MRDNDSVNRPGNFDPPRVLIRLSVVSVEFDYLVCHPFYGDDTENVNEVRYVLRPWTLQRTPFEDMTLNGVTYTYDSNIQRTASSGSDTETQKITQDYYAGSVIYAMLFQPKAKLEGGPADGKYTALIDANLDARAWAVP